MPESAQVPTILVVFGATGDLMEKKIVPALFQLHLHQRLPKLFQVIAISHRSMSTEEFGEHVMAILRKSHDAHTLEPQMQAFMSLFHYLSGDFGEEPLYETLAEKLGSIDNTWSVCTNKLYYLAVPPSHYEEIVKNLSKKQLNVPCSEEEGYTRIIVEKPFGHDRDSANLLHQLLSQNFKEEQIYRLDHYLGKRMLQNLMAFRFSNTFFDGAWTNKYIEKIEIKLLETNDVSQRGDFYDGLGALRDVGQNHLLEFLAGVCMDNPEVLESKAVRRSRAQFLSTVLQPKDESLTMTTYRAQYDGYLQEKGVAEHSSTETYFKIQLESTHPLWRGVPIILEAGKALKEQKKEVVITFKKPIPSLLPPGGNTDARNKMLFKLEPEESIQLDLWAKKEGYEMFVEDKRFLLNEREADNHIQYTEEYEKLLLDAFIGDQTFFVSQSEIAEMWRIVDPIVCGWGKNSVPLNHYPKGTDAVRGLAKEWIDSETKESGLSRHIGIIGLGKMGSNLAKNLLSHEWTVVGFNRSPEATESLTYYGLTPSYDLTELVTSLPSPRVVWLMLPHGDPTTQTVTELSNVLNTGDIVIDGGNSHFEDAKKHEEILRAKGIEFVDVGVSGGPRGALTGASLMIGGKQKLFEHLYPLFLALGYPGGVAHFEGVGAGHYVKMVHNGIEYGMMQSLAEGFTMLSHGPFPIDLSRAADVYANGSVIESRLVNWLANSFAEYGPHLEGVKGSVSSLGEGDWAVEYAEKQGLINWSMKAAVDFRKETQNNPSFTGQILSAIRGQFGGHPVTNSNE